MDDDREDVPEPDPELDPEHPLAPVTDEALRVRDLLAEDPDRHDDEPEPDPQEDAGEDDDPA